MTNPFSWAVAQLANVQRVERKEPKFNPRPAGVIQAGSATEAVLQILRANPKTYYTCGRLLELTGRTHAAVSWSLIFLRKQGLVKAIEDGSRNPRWMRYAADVGAQDVEIAEQPRTKAGKKCLASDEAPMPGARVSGFPTVRGRRNSDLPAVAGELRAVPGGHGTASEPGALAWAEGHKQALHPRELPLDGANPAEAAAPILPQGDGAGPDADSGRGGEAAGTADQEHGRAPLGSWIQPRAPEAGEALQALDVAHLPGRDAAITGVGPTPWLAEQSCVEPDQARDATQRGLFPADAPDTSGHHFQQTLNAIAA